MQDLNLFRTGLTDGCAAFLHLLRKLPRHLGRAVGRGAVTLVVQGGRALPVKPPRPGARSRPVASVVCAPYLPSFGTAHDARQIAELLGLEERGVRSDLPLRVVSTGLPFIIVPLAGLDAVRRCRPRREALLDYVESCEAKAILVFARETYHRDNDLHVRVFTEAFGIPEDPATGSANGCLAGYLSRYRVLGSANVDVRVEQGHEVGRPSLLLLRAGPAGDAIEVHVGGGVIPVAAGELL